MNRALKGENREYNKESDTTPAPLPLPVIRVDLYHTKLFAERL